MKFEVHATVSEVYIVEAADFDEAIKIASERTEPNYYANVTGFDYVLNIETQQEKFL